MMVKATNLKATNLKAMNLKATNSKSMLIAKLVIGSSILLAASVFAHHSFAPHFDASKPVHITGVVTEFEERNPHAYLHIRAENADGLTQEWECESHGVTQLTRNGISPDMLAVGSTVQIDGSQHRRDPLQCFFDTLHLADGRVLSVNGPAGQRADAPQVAQRASMFGVWLLAPAGAVNLTAPAGRATSGPQFMMDFTTDVAKAEIAKYNPFVDDPTYRCEPVAIRRAWGAPGTPMALRQSGADIIIQHEWMDVERVVHMNETAAPAGTPETILGYSRGRMEGDELVVETDHYNQGVLNQFVEVKDQPMRALLHSNELRTVERISFDAPSNRIKLSVEMSDPKYFTQDFPIAQSEFAASDMEIKPFGCIPELLK